MKRLHNKTAIITGSSRGIGRDIAINLAKEGAQVVINYTRQRDKADEVVKEIEGFGGKAIAIQADVSQLESIRELYNQTEATLGKVDIVVNNAGIMELSPLENVTEELFDRHMAINVKGTYFMVQEAYKRLSNNGRIINFSTSVVGNMMPAYSVYAASKGAVEQITRQLAKEVADRGITINAVAPGPVATELFLEGKSEALISQLSGLNAFKRLGETEDIAKVVTFLASEESQWITGQTIRVNGGFN